MAISASDVKKLRDLTGAGMMDCKTALTETEGDIEAAVDWLRKKGISKADKKADRTAAEGLVAFASEGTSGVVVEVNSETDFVARNDAFQAMVSGIADIALTTDGSVEAIAASNMPGSAKSVADTIKDTIGTIGENMALRRSEKITVANGVVATYMHNVIAPEKPNLGKIAVLVGLETTGDAEAALAIGRQIAMHVAAINPLALSPDEVSEEVAEREKAIFIDQARASGKPDNIIEKMVEGRMRKFFEEVALLKQAFVINPDHTVEQALKEAEGKVGAPIKITKFVRLALGEGVEKEVSDFAAEVASMNKA